MIKLALTDMDNTLVPFGQDRVSDSVFEAVSLVREAGLRFGPATGRDEQELRRFFGGDESCFETGILSNGKKVKLDGELVAVHYMDKVALQRLADAFFAVPGVFLCAYPAKTDYTNPVYVLGARTAEMAAYESRLRFNGIPCEQLPDIDFIAGAMACSGSKENMDNVRRIAACLAPEFDIVAPIANWFDVLPKGVSKASGLDELIAAMGISDEEVAFFGDGENDIKMMGRVPNSVAVANAMPAAAEAARWHIGACLDDGVPVALRELARVAGTDEPADFMRA